MLEQILYNLTVNGESQVRLWISRTSIYICKRQPDYGITDFLIHPEKIFLNMQKPLNINC